MNTELLILFLLGTPLLGAVVTAFAPAHERRWTVVLTLVITLGILGALGLSFLDESARAQTHLGPLSLVVDAFALTVGPPLVLGRLVLALSGGRSVVAANDTIWLLGLLSVELLGLLTGNPAVLIIAEGLSAAILARRLYLRGQRAQTVYLAVELAVLIGALVVLLTDGVNTFTGVPPALGLALVLAGLLRLGIFPLSTGVLSSLSKRFDPTTLVAVLPVGGILLIARFGTSLTAYPGIHDALVTWVEIAAPLTAAMAIAQRTLPRALGYTLLASYAQLALLMLDRGPYHLAIAGEFWSAVLLSGAGLGAAAYLVSLRFGEVDLDRFSGFQRHTPRLSVLFLILGFALAGAPGSLQFIAEDFLLNTAELGFGSTLLIVATIALTGFSVLRMHFRIFYGRDLLERDFMRLRGREGLGLLALVAALLVGGLLPSTVPLVSTVRAHSKAAHGDQAHHPGGEPG